MSQSQPPPPPTNGRNPADAYAAWLRARRQHVQDADVSAHVMEQVKQMAPPLRPWWDRTWILASAWAAASLLLVIRVVALFAVFWAA